MPRKLHEAGERRKSQYERTHTATQSLIDAALERDAMLKASRRRPKDTLNGHNVEAVAAAPNAVVVFAQPARVEGSFTSLLEELSIEMHSESTVSKDKMQSASPVPLGEVLLIPGQEQALSAVIASAMRRLPSELRRSRIRDVYRREEVVNTTEALDDLSYTFSNRLESSPEGIPSIAQ